MQALYDRPVLIADGAQPAAVGDTIYLPRTLDARGGRENAEARYRLYALEQAERLARGTPTLTPVDPLERDLYWLSEAAAVDATLARAMPGVRAALAAARAVSRENRRPKRRAPLEQEVEKIVQALLAGEPIGGAIHSTPAESVEWAKKTALSLRERHPERGRYREAEPVELWGQKAVDRHVNKPEPEGAQRTPLRLPMRGTRAKAQGDGGEGEGTVGFSNTPSAPAGQTEEHPEGAAVADGTRGQEEAEFAAPRGESGVTYPEWDRGTKQYRPNAVLVHPGAATEGDAEWSAGIRAERAALVRRVRQRFEALRARRSRLGQQKEGDELDLSATVRALVDIRTGGPADDRWYIAVRPARRPIAIALLADVSGSTEAPVTATQRVIDVEKVALLLASEALDALGDPYAMLTFASRGTRNVRVMTIKDFGEPTGDTVRRRVSGMHPHGNTRMGAAVRHATALLLRQNAGHRLLLILSDGRPSDQDGYHEQYGVEDTRQAVLEARGYNVFPFCLTVDREGADYLPHIFGDSGHTILRHADQLPLALLQVVRQLLAS